MDHVIIHTRPCRPLGLLARLKQARTLRRQRLALAELNDHLLADIGITSGEALAEAERPVWDAPANWRK